MTPFLVLLVAGILMLIIAALRVSAMFASASNRGRHFERIYHKPGSSSATKIREAVGVDD